MSRARPDDDNSVLFFAFSAAAPKWGIFRYGYGAHTCNIAPRNVRVEHSWNFNFVKNFSIKRQKAVTKVKTNCWKQLTAWVEIGQKAKVAKESLVKTARDENGGEIDVVRSAHSIAMHNVSLFDSALRRKLQFFFVHFE